MAEFLNADRAEETKLRLARMCPVDLAPVWGEGFSQCSDPDMALANLDRWLNSTGNPATYLGMLAQSRCRSGFLAVLGGSRPCADAIIQNPELGGLLLEGGISEPVSKQRMLSECRSLLASASGYSHSLDRLRYLKQLHLLPIVMNDLMGTWEQPAVWRAISDLAGVIVECTSEVVWRECGLSPAEPLPIMVVAFGKLGGSELNYSSDVDLVLVSEDGLSPEIEKQVNRFAELLPRALSERMGRGSLYRVDLRLRPFGAAGSLVATMRSVEGYYLLHAQTWEVQALIRSTAITGSDSMRQRWASLVDRTCFKPKTSEGTIQEIVEMRVRTESSSDPNDIKRGSGGIRDIEFLTQVLQMLHGHDEPDVRAQATLNALGALASKGFIDAGGHRVLSEGYVFLRKLEHRLQLLEDRQTHSLPSGEAERRKVARLMGLNNWEEASARIDKTREAVSSAYREWLGKRGESSKELLSRRLGPLMADVESWFGSLPESESFLQVLASNAGSLDRVQRTIEFAPVLLPSLRASTILTEEILSGEIEEGAGVVHLSRDPNLDKIGESLLRTRTRLLASWNLAPLFDLGAALGRLMDRVVETLCSRLGAKFSVVGLGSYGLSEVSLASDADLVFLVADREDHAEAESQAQEFLSLIDRLKRWNPALKVDLRLRPEGGKGLLVRTYEGLKNYELGEMELWERFALGQCRLVLGRSDALAAILDCAYALPLTPERLKELVAMKHRIESERVPPQFLRRDIKLGQGGLGDIEWFVHLHEMRYPTATAAASAAPMSQRIRNLAEARLIHAIELEVLLQARKHLAETRHRLGLLGFDVVPENPDKLTRLAAAAGYPDGNAFLAYHEEMIDSVRSIYNDGLDRLKA